MKIIWTAKYLNFKREFENIFNIYFSYRYEPYPLRIQSNKFHEGTYGVRFQIQFLCSQHILVLPSTPPLCESYLCYSRCKSLVVSL